MFKRVLICTDFLDSLQRLAQFVPDLARGGMEHIVFLHNVSFPKTREIPVVDEAKVEQARQTLAVAQSNVPAGVTVELEVPSGRASDNIIRAVKKHQPELIFSGMPIRSALNERLFGSTTLTLADKAETPLLILRPQLVSTYRSAELSQRCQHLFEYLLVPYDGSASAENLLEKLKAKMQADAGRSLKTCLLCWAVDDSGRVPSKDQAAIAQTKLEAAKAKLEGLGAEIKTQVRIGNPLEEIIRAGAEHDISAIAVCSGRSSGLLKLTVPSFTNAILRESWHPIIHFPQK
jgi:nucleotide-binding universal stress UspA family protein